MTALEMLKEKFGRREAIHLVLRDAMAKRMLVAWTCIYHPPVADFVVSDRDAPEKVRERLWEEIGPINYALLGRIAAVPESRVEPIFARLMAGDLVYPDGTISPFAQKLLGAEAVAWVSGMSRRKPGQ